MAEKRCAFCKRPTNEVKKLIGGPDGPFICDRCTTAAGETLAADQKSSTKVDEKPLLKPREIKAFLDEHVISQEKAKQDVAVAVYNHYKRREAIRRGMKFDCEIKKSNILLLGPSGCHRKGQKVLMFDGTLQAVERVRVGDQLMGPDSTARTVLELHYGVEEMVEILPTKGEPWVVNKGHILTLVRTGYNGGSGYRPANEVKDVPLQDYQEWSKTQKSVHKLFRVAVDFAPGPELPLDPYFLGILLGDGCLRNRVSVTNTDPEIVKEVYFQAAGFGLHVAIEAEGTSSVTYHLSGGKGGGSGNGSKPNPIATKLKELGLWDCDSESKFIPYVYRTASKQDRLALLAGLIDTDGSLDCNCYDYVSKSKALAENVAFVARSLGLAAYLKPCRKYDQNGTWGDYFRVMISGDVEQILVRVPYKKAHKRRQIKSVLKTGFKTRELPPEEYFGFVLDGDHRYLLDDFTVTHNTGKTEIARTISKMLGVPFYNADATKMTQAGYVGDDVESMIQGLLQDASGDVERAEWGVIFLDEVDKLARKSGRGASGYRDVTGEGVQQALLKMIEGTKVRTPRGGRMVSGQEIDVVDTENVLFICAGSFAGIEEVVQKRVNKDVRLGFGSAARKDVSEKETYLAIEEEDILEFGIIPELLGRLPVHTTTLPLTEEEMVRILTEPKSAIVKQFKALFQMDGIDLQFDEAALKAIGKEAQKRPTGARALRSIMEKILRPYSYDYPSEDEITAVRIIEDVVTGKGEAVVVREGRKKEPKPTAMQG